MFYLRLSVLSLSFIATTLLLMSCNGGGQSAYGHALDRVNATGKIKLAAINYPPSMIVSPNGSSRSGIMHEVMESMAENLNVEIEYVEETTWATMIEAVRSKRVDAVVSGIWPSSERARKADFTSAVYYSPVFAYVRANDGRFDGHLDQIIEQRARLAAIDGELSSIIARTDYPSLEVVSLPNSTDVSQLLLQLTTNKADVTFVEGAIASEFLKKNPGSIRRIAEVPPVRSFPNTFLVAKGDNLRTTLNIAIAELHGMGTIQRILDKYDPGHEKFVRVAP